MTFTPLEVLSAALANPEFVAEFDRLSGTNLSLVGSPLELQIDKSTGRLEHDVRKFLSFIGDLAERLPK